MADLEQGPKTIQVNSFHEDSTETLEGGCNIHWIGISKSVKLAEDETGLLNGSIGGSSSKKVATHKVILDNISGYASPGEILALMGPSGSGKTSLLDALSGRSTFNHGTLTLNGTEVTPELMKKFKRKVAYVKQSDIFFEHLSVRDQLTYTALLRLPSKLSRAQKNAEVDNIINLLRLQKCANTPIKLVSGGEKKRVNIGTELLTNPELIILDEPTSGLDSTSAVALLKTLHELAIGSGKTVITSIHQPSSAVFRNFDKVMFLAEGHTVYFGSPASSLSYLDSIKLSCPSGYNAADYWMDLLVQDSTIDDNYANSDEKKEMESGMDQNQRREYLIENWDDKKHATEVSQHSENQKSSAGQEVSFLDNGGKKYNNSWTTQFLVLMHRAMRNSRSAIFTPLNLTKSLAIGIIMGLIWFQLPYTERTVTDRVGYFFFTMTYWVFDSMFQAFMSFPMERNVIFKERASGSYHLSAYFLAKSCSEAPTRMALPIIYLIPSYWLAGINNNFVVFLGTIFCSLLSVLVGESYGLLVGAAVLDIEKGMVVLTVSSLTLMALGGFFVQNIPSFFSWVKYLSAFKYAFDASQQMVFNRDVPCDGSGLLEVCKGLDVGYATPEELITFVNAQGSIGFNIAMLFVLFVIPRYFAYLFLLKSKGGERI